MLFCQRVKGCYQEVNLFFLFLKKLFFKVGEKFNILQFRDVLFEIILWEEENCKGFFRIDFDFCKDMNYNDQRVF